MSEREARPKWRFLCRRIALGLILLLVGVEGGARLLRVADVPLFWADQEIGYEPQVSQSGRFLWWHSWSFNALGMRSGPFEPDRREGDVLLLGDSLVFGGNPLDQTETWGAQLEAAMGGSVSVWAMGAPSWSSANEVVWLRRHDEILPKMEAVVWVLNSGDFFGRSQWSSSLDHPLASPWSHAVWAVLKYGMPRIYPQWRRPAVVHDAVFANEGVVRAYWREFLGQMSREKPHLRWCFVLYPNQYELARTESAPVWKVWCDGVKGLVAESGLKGWVEVLGEREGWRPEYYRDFIHPNAEGNRVLANKTSEWLRDTMEDK